MQCLPQAQCKHLQLRQEEDPLHTLLHDWGNSRSMERSVLGWKEWNLWKLHRLHCRTQEGLLRGQCQRRSMSTAMATQARERHCRQIYHTIQDLCRTRKVSGDSLHSQPLTSTHSTLPYILDNSDPFSITLRHTPWHSIKNSMYSIVLYSIVLFSIVFSCT